MKEMREIKHAEPTPGLAGTSSKNRASTILCSQYRGDVSLSLVERLGSTLPCGGARALVEEGATRPKGPPRSAGNVPLPLPEQWRFLLVLQENRKSAEETENYRADEQESTGYSNIVDKKLPLSTTHPAVVHWSEGSIGRTAAEFRVSHSPTSLACRGRFPVFSKASTSARPLAGGGLYIIPIRLVGYFFSISPH